MVIRLRSGRYVVVGERWASRIFNVVIDIRRLRWPAESAFLAHRGPDEPRQRAPRTIRHEPQQRPLGSERRKHHRGYTTIHP
ncbi:hypothetical protein VDGL01_02812 [Verticillium dahliae]